MTERLQVDKFQTDPNRMAIIEAGWIRAWEMGEEREFLTYFESGLKLQYHLDESSAKKAAQSLVEFLRAPDLKTKKENLFEYHRIISVGSGIGFDPDLATKTWMEIEQNEEATIAQLSKYRSILFGGLSGKDMFSASRLRKEALDGYQLSRQNRESPGEEGRAFARLVGKLAESNELFNIVLRRPSVKLS